MKIAIGTNNDLKVKAISSALRKVYPDAEIVKVDVPSGVKDNPVGREEGMLGALNRARNARDKAKADMGVGPEGITETTAYGSFVYGWVAIVDSEGKVGFGASAQVMLPAAVEDRVLGKHMTMDQAMSEVSKKSKDDIRFKHGTNGVLTNGMYGREREFQDATTCALARFVSDYYKE
jgi:inosine/xanthosine triphosphatase